MHLHKAICFRKFLLKSQCSENSTGINFVRVFSATERLWVCVESAPAAQMEEALPLQTSLGN
jgi:hypothetical protein